MKKDRPARLCAWRTIADVYREFLARLPAHSAIAVEASGSYSWLVDEMERAGHRPKLCNPLEAKRRMATDQEDRQVGCERAGDPASQRHPAGSVDSTERTPRSTRAAAAADLSGASADASKESHPRCIGASQRADAGSGSVRRRQLDCKWRNALPELPVHSREAIEQELATLDFLELFRSNQQRNGWKRL